MLVTSRAIMIAVTYMEKKMPYRRKKYERNRRCGRRAANHSAGFVSRLSLIDSRLTVSYWVNNKSLQRGISRIRVITSDRNRQRHHAPKANSFSLTQCAFRISVQPYFPPATAITICQSVRQKTQIDFCSKSVTHLITGLP